MEADKILDGVPMAFRVGEVERAGHGLKTEGFVVHVQRCEGNGVGAILRRPPGGRLDSVQHQQEGLKGGEISKADVARSCW